MITQKMTELIRLKGSRIADLQGMALISVTNICHCENNEAMIARYIHNGKATGYLTNAAQLLLNLYLYALFLQPPL